MGEQKEAIMREKRKGKLRANRRGCNGSGSGLENC